MCFEIVFEFLLIDIIGSDSDRKFNSVLKRHFIDIVENHGDGGGVVADGRTTESSIFDTVVGCFDSAGGGTSIISNCIPVVAGLTSADEAVPAYDHQRDTDQATDSEVGGTVAGIGG